MQKVVLATKQRRKVRELASLLEDFGLDIVAQTELGVDSAEETYLTFIENAILKARHAAQITTCLPSPTIPVWPSMLLAARRVFTPHAIPASTPATSRILRSCSTR